MKTLCVFLSLAVAISGYSSVNEVSKRYYRTYPVDEKANTRRIKEIEAKFGIVAPPDELTQPVIKLNPHFRFRRGRDREGFWFVALILIASSGKIDKCLILDANSPEATEVATRGFSVAKFRPARINGLAAPCAVIYSVRAN